ncbi:hypothetical protein [Bacillus cereus]|nr:hypothetical protein [Bacillus cereus]
MNDNQTAKIFQMPRKSYDSPSVEPLAQDKSENVRNHKFKSLNEETVDLKNWQNTLHELAASVEAEGDEMEELKEKIHEIDKKISLIEERVKKLDQLPSGSEIKQIVSEVIDSKNLVSIDKMELETTKMVSEIIDSKNKNLASIDKMELAITNSRNVQIIWTVGTIVAVVSLAVAAIKLL